MSPPDTPRRVRDGSLRARLFALLRESCVPLTTVELYLVAATDQRRGMIRVLQVLYREELYGRVKRLPPLGGADPSGPRRGRPSLRWALTPLGLLAAGGED